MGSWESTLNTGGKTLRIRSEILMKTLRKFLVTGDKILVTCGDAPDSVLTSLDCDGALGTRQEPKGIWHAVGS